MPWDDMQETIKKKLGTKPSKPEMGMIESPTGEMRAPRNLNERGTAMGIDRGGNFTPERMMAAAEILATVVPMMMGGELVAGGAGSLARAGGTRIAARAGASEAGVLKPVLWQAKNLAAGGRGGPMSKAPTGQALTDVIKVMRRQMTGMKPPGVK